MTGVRLAGHDLGMNLDALASFERQGEVGVPPARDLHRPEGQANADQEAEKERQSQPPHTSMVARWRVLRCNICRRPIQRSMLMPGSVTLATCRRDRATFVFTVAESGALLVMQRG